MGRTVAAIVLSASMLTGLLPRKAEAGMLEGALIGAAVGAIVGVIAQASKPKPTEIDMKKAAVPADSVASADSIPVFR